MRFRSLPARRPRPGAARGAIHLHFLDLVETEPNSKPLVESRECVLATKAFDQIDSEESVLITDGAKLYPGLSRDFGDEALPVQPWLHVHTGHIMQLGVA